MTKKNDFIVPRVVNKTDIPKDLSTWADELCFFSAERSLIHFKKGKGSYLIKHNEIENTIDYENYWKCIIRGIEFSCLIRMALRIIESTSRKMVQHIPNHLIDVKKIEIDQDKFLKFKEEIPSLQSELAHFLKIVPELRSAANAVNSFRSERNVKKFNHLQDVCFGFNEILDNIQKNIDDLTYFVNSFEQRVLQQTVENENTRKTEEDRKLALIALFFTATSILYVFPSFVHDFAEWDFIKRPVWNSSIISKEGKITAIYFTVLIITGCLGGLKIYGKQWMDKKRILLMFTFVFFVLISILLLFYSIITI